jgi:hypothetical protein
MGRIRYVYNAGVAGTRIDQMLAKFDTVVAPQKPDVVVLTAGTNDIGQGRTMAQWLADLNSYLAKVQKLGAQLIVGAIWPSDTNDPVNRSATARTWNTELYKWAAENNVQVLPWDTLCDPFTGGWPTGWSSDGLHPGLLDSYAQIGKLGWNTVSPRVGTPNLRRAISNGADNLPNGFFSLTAAQAPPNLTAGTSSTASGTLPAGTYSYKYTSRTYWGESLPSAERQVTLAGTGNITITNSTVSGSRGYRVYRKAPGDTTWKYLTYLSTSTTTTFNDTGALTATTDISNTDTSRYPTGLIGGSSSVHTIGPVTTTEAGIRGNIFRILPYESTTNFPNDYYQLNVTPGDTYSMSALVRSTGTAEAVFVARFRDGSNVTVGQVYVARDRMTNGWGLAHVQFVVPPNAATVRIGFELADGTSTGYGEFAEVQFRKI